MTERELMKQALITYFLPELRERGFEGSFPHYRRITEQKADLLTVVFDKWGGSFALELSYVYFSEKPDNLLVGQARLAPEDLTVYKTYQRNHLPKPDDWIHFCDCVRIKTEEGDKIYFLTEGQKKAFLKNIPEENVAIEAAGEGVYCRSAAAAVKLLKDAEQWWGEHTPYIPPERNVVPENTAEQVFSEPQKRWGFFKLIQGGKRKKKN